MSEAELEAGCQVESQVLHVNVELIQIPRMQPCCIHVQVLSLLAGQQF